MLGFKVAERCECLPGLHTLVSSSQNTLVIVVKPASSLIAFFFLFCLCHCFSLSSNAVAFPTSFCLFPPFLQFLSQTLLSKVCIWAQSLRCRWWLGNYFRLLFSELAQFLCCLWWVRTLLTLHRSRMFNPDSRVFLDAKSGGGLLSPQVPCPDFIR